MKQGTVYTVVPGQATCRLGDDLALLELERGTYYTLNRTGALLWERLSQPCSASDLRAELATGYDLDPAACARDVAAFLDAMLDAGLVQVAGEG